MMSTSVPYQVLYKNQLQFNLGVPLTTQNLAVQFNKPSPILVERVGGQHGIPAKLVPKQSLAGTQKDSGSSVFNYSTLSVDKMEMMSQLAKRDLRNRNLQAQMKNKSPSSESLSPHHSPSCTRFRHKNLCERFVRQEAIKPRKPLTAREADKNRRLGAVQTPPPRRPATYARGDESMMSARNTSVNMTKESDVYFPAKPIMPDGGSQYKSEVDKLQQEIEGYLLLIERIGERVIADPDTKFLHLPVKGKRKDEFLIEDETSDRVRMRVEEQNTRLTRTLYNLKLKVKQLQRDAAHADLSKPIKRNQISSQLCIVHRGAVKTLQTFVNQLPYHDLKEGLPSHYHELSLLLRQLTALTALTKQGKESDGDTSLLTALDRVDNLNTKWSLDRKNVDTETSKRDKKPAVTKDWVSDTKVDRDIFVMKNQPNFMFPPDVSKFISQQPRQQQTQRGRPKKRAVGKENRSIGPASTRGRDTYELRSAVATLLQPKVKATGASRKETNTNSGTAWDIEMGRQQVSQDHRKGYLLPYDLIVKREKAQRAVALSNQERRCADPVGNLKKSPSRPNSAPANVSRHKGVNFELDKQSSMPWIPPGRSSRSRSLSSEPKSQSRMPFYVRDMDSDDVGFMFPDKHSLKNKITDNEIPKYGFHSLPNEKKLRSADVSNSFIDEVEHRLLRRLMGKVGAENGKASRKNTVPYMSQRKESVSADVTRDTYSDLDEALDTAEDIRQEAVSAVDAPTIENMKLRLAEIQREQREIRQRWSSLKFTDTKPRSRIFTSSLVQADRFRDPPAIEVTRMSKTERPKHPEMPITEWKEEPLIFTKPSTGSRISYLHTIDHTKQNDLGLVSSLVQGKPAKKLVTLKQMAVEKIQADRDRFESYLRKRSHHPSGKFDPWKLVEEISDEILSDCLADVAAEVELISEEIANHMYKSEFVVDTSRSEDVLHRKHIESPQNQPMGDLVPYSHVRSIPVEPVGKENAADNKNSPGIREKSPVFDNGGQQKINAEKPLTERSLSTPRSLAYSSPEKLSPTVSIAEPSLDNISQPHYKGDAREERGGGDMENEGEAKKDEDYEDDYEKESSQEDSNESEYEHDDNEYEQDDFEDVSDDD